ncbi:MAG: hypothetical protein ACFFG0_23590 [Candidatus Thorarchaeota archaeon]
MSDWVILPREITANIHISKIVNTNNYTFYSNIEKNDYLLMNNKGIFLFGYILPVLSNPDNNTTPKNLLSKYKEFGDNFINNYKGIFTIIIIDNNKIKFFNDRFGLSKFFYIDKGKKFIGSNNLKLLSEFHSKKISKTNVFEYFILNYFTQGNTIYEGIKYSRGGTNFHLNSDLEKKYYFDIRHFMQHRSKELNIKKDIFHISSEIWTNIINQYLNHFSNKKISLTLTAGLDSRMILAAMRKIKFIPLTFTFGHKDSMDVRGARRIAKKLDLKHYHFFPEEKVLQNFQQSATDTVIKGDSLVTLFRAHRLDAYYKIKEYSDVIFFGFIGSEIIRGLYPDGLVINKLASSIWLNDKLNIKDFIINHFKKYFLSIPKNIIDELTERLSNYTFLYKSDQYLFEMIIPLHFGQDIRLLEKIGIFSLCPFWDIDFLEFIKNTPFFISNNRQKDFAKLGHFRRRKQPLFSSKLINILDKDSSRIPLGKGYSPREFAFSQNYSALKFLIYKFVNKFKSHDTPNFSYGNWYLNFLGDSLKNCNWQFLNINKQLIYKDIAKIIMPSDELNLLQFTQFINIDLIRRNL